MSQTYQTENTESGLDSLERQYGEAPEPTKNGVTHAPGKYTVVLKDVTTREVPLDDKPTLVFVTIETEVVLPAQNTSPAGQLPNGRTEIGNTLKIEQNIASEIGMKVFKSYARALGVNTGTLKGDLAAMKAQAGKFYEIQYKHKANKETGEIFPQVFINREVTA